MPGKPTFEEYPAWLNQHFKIDLSDNSYRAFYDLTATQLLTTVNEHPFFVRFQEKVDFISKDYKGSDAYELMMLNSEINLVKKSFPSVIEKSYRKNITGNKNFPSPPDGGWLLPENWIGKLNDIVRGTVVTKYIDGPQFLASKLTHEAEAQGLIAFFESKESDSGYYAFHFYINLPVRILQRDLSETNVDLMVEIQITTQLQEVLRQLTHGFYEQIRLQMEHNGSNWKWDFESPRFQASYLGHTLHLLEAVIVQLKQKALAVQPMLPAEAEGDKK